MKFILESTNWCKPDEIIKRYPSLHRFGLEKRLVKRPLYDCTRDENGKRIFQVNGYEDKEKCNIYLYSLEELLKAITMPKSVMPL